MKLGIRLNACNIGFLVYLCALSGHQQETTLDHAIELLSFLFFVGMTLYEVLGKRQGSMRISGFALWYLAFMVFAYSSVVWARYSHADVFYYFTKQVQLLAVAIFLPVCLRDEKDFDDKLLIIVISLIYAGLLLLSRTPFSSFGTERMGEAIGMDKNGFGMRMAIGALLVLYLMKKSDHKLWYILIMVLFIFLALMTGSKKAVFMIVAGIFSIGIFTSNSKKRSHTLLIILLTVVALGILVYVIFTNQYVYNVLGSRLVRTYLYLTEDSVIDDSTMERQYYISTAQQLFKSSPILGIGYNNFMSYLRVIGYSHVAYCHNNYWELLSCLGVAGTVLFYSMHIYILVKLQRIARDSKSPLAITFLIVLIIYLICDYANVSNCSIFQYAIICLIFEYTRLVRKGAITKKYDYESVGQKIEEIPA